MSVAAMFVVIFLACAGAAHAGTYTIGDCPSAANHSNVAGPWQPFGVTPQTVLKAECAGDTPVLYTAIPYLPSTPLGFRMTTAGTHLSIVGLRLWWRAFGSPSGEVEAETEVTDSSGDPLDIGAAAGSGELYEHMTEPEELSFPAGQRAQTIKLAEHCDPGGECHMTESLGISIEIFGAELTLDDEIPPTASIAAVQSEGTGPFGSPIAVAFNASDGDAGVLKSELLLDGAVVATHDYSGSCSYTRLQPCPGAMSDRFTGVPLPESEHQLAVRVTDAAGNTTVTPVPPIANGVPCAAPTLALTADHKAPAITVPYGSGATIEGRLACGATPVPHATLQVTSATPGTTTAAAAAPVATGADGTFSYQVAPGASRRLGFSYRAYSNEAGPATQASLEVDVRPRISLQIAPRRTRNGRKIKWIGRVEGGPYPANGVTLLIQVKEGKRWQTFDTVVVHNGILKYRYQFKRTHHTTTYTFRIALPANGSVGYPYTTAASRGIPIRVRR